MVVDDEELVSMGMRALARRRWRATSPEERKRVSADMQRAREERRRERERERELASALRERPERQAGDVAASPQAKVGEPEKDE